MRGRVPAYCPQRSAAHGAGDRGCGDRACGSPWLTAAAVEEGPAVVFNVVDDDPAPASEWLPALDQGDMAALEEILAQDVVLYGDGGGKAPQLARPVHGAGHVARILLAWRRAADRSGGYSLDQQQVNGAAGAVLGDVHKRIVGVLALEVTEERVHVVRSVVNPEKLAHLGEVGDLAGLLRGEG